MPLWSVPSVNSLTFNHHRAASPTLQTDRQIARYLDARGGCPDLPLNRDLDGFLKLFL